MILLFMKTVPFRMDHFPFYVIHIWHLFIIMRCVCSLLMFVLFTFAFNFIQCSLRYDVRCVYSVSSVRRLLSHPHSDKHLRIDCYLLLDLITIYRIPNNTCSSAEGFWEKKTINQRRRNEEKHKYKSNIWENKFLFIILSWFFYYLELNSCCW